MFFKNKTKNLEKIIEPYSSWNNDGNNLQAKQALEILLVELKKIKPSMHYIRRDEYFGYVGFLLKAKQAFEEKLYQRTCNELQSLLHYYCTVKEKTCIAPEIKVSLIDLLEKYLS
ncbi:MAG: hypothetical protein RR052_00845 [Oscillospiraceae bacterium]